MGVMACDRSGCTNVMSDILVEHQHVCSECASEFRDAVGSESLPIREMSMKFKAFMRSEKPEYHDNRVVGVDKFLRQPK